MEELIKYLGDNKIGFSSVDDDFVMINDELYFLVRPDEEGLLFTEDLILIADEPTCVKYVYNFGGNWYWENKEDYDKPKLNELKYIGKAVDSISTDHFLGVRGTYEILNGSRLYEDWCKKAKFLGCTALGICEKNTLAGLLKFQLECQKNKIKPILGATYTIFREEADFKYDIKVYVQDEIGWKNLLAINKEVNVINHKFIHENRFMELLDGLVIIVDPKSLPFDRVGKLARKSIIDYYQLDSVEFSNNDRDKEYLENLKKYVRSDFHPIAITDAFYLDKEHSHIKRTLNAISGVRESESNNQHFKSKDEYCDEIESLFSKEDESFYDIFGKALNAEYNVTQKCNFLIETSNKYLPKYIMTQEEKEKYGDSLNMLWSLIGEGLDKKVDPKRVDEYIDQIQKEYEIIEYGNLQDYFLINWEQTEWCKKNNILTGLSRGSASGFQTSNILNITKIDPFDYNLIAERFLTKQRAKDKIADIDIDHEQGRKEEVKQHLIDKYGFDQCCSVGTFGTFQIKGGLKDIAKIKGVAFAEVNYVSSILDAECKEWVDVFRVAAKNSRLKAFIHQYPDVISELFLILNAKRNCSTHASAFIITPSDKTIYEWMPVKLDPKAEVPTLISEWEGVELEEAGFLKQDILGLLQLDKFHKIVDLIKENQNIDIDIYDVPLDCRKTLSYFSKGWNNDVFQFGAKGLSSYCTSLKPQSINDLIATIALYRPGPMENNFHNEYILRKSGDRAVDYYSGTEEILKKTYGLIVYQEDVMQICQKLAGFDLAETDDVRKAMGKKKADVLLKYKTIFIDKSVENGYEKEEMSELWDTMEKFAGYAFNLAHAAAYGITGYTSQWLKANFPTEFWTTAFEFAKDTQIANYISEINQTGAIKIMPANINKSRDNVYTDFKNKVIYWPLISIKQCGEKAASQIIELRDKDGQYFTFEEFIQRNKFKGSKVTKQVIENLVLSGAFDEIEHLGTFESRLKLILQYRKISKTKIDLEKDLFELDKSKLREEWWWILQQKRLSGIAFFDYRDLTSRYLESDLPYMEAADFQNESNSDERKKVKIGGYITEVEERTSKKGKWARIKLENNYTFINVVIWAEQYKQIENLNLAEKEKALLLITGQISNDSYHKENVLQANDDTELLILI